MLHKLLPKRVRSTLRTLRDRMVGPALVLQSKRRLKRSPRSRSHLLPGELIISLTSYPARFGTLHLTLACLLDQSVKPDRTILWVASNDVAKLPSEVTELESRGLEIRTCDELRSYKKLIPALEAFPNAFIATADDDIYYRRDWLETLVNGAGDDVIACHRAHRIARLAAGTPRPYSEWERDVQDARARRPSKDLLATSGAGALYPPGSLARIVTDRTKFDLLCRNGDDLWFHWCAGMAGTYHKKVGRKMLLTPWPGSQPSTLWDVNEHGGNDRMIAALQEAFGYPD